MHLTEGTVFDTTDGEGQIVHAPSGECFALDRIATILLQAGLNYSSYFEALGYLQTCIDATSEELEEELRSMLQELASLRLISDEPVSPASPAPDLVAGAFPFSGNCQHPPAVDRPARKRFLWLESARPDDVDWEFFLTGSLKNSPLPRLSSGQRAYALWCALLSLLIMGGHRGIAGLFALIGCRGAAQWVRLREWSRVCRYLSSIHASATGFETLEGEVMVRLARRELLYCQIVTRLLAPTGMCLVRSAAFCAYLRALALPGQLAIGRELFYLSDDSAFHAWVEIRRAPANDRAELLTGYSVLQRVPPDDAAHARDQKARFPMPVVAVLFLLVLWYLFKRGAGRHSPSR